MPDSPRTARGKRLYQCPDEALRLIKHLEDRCRENAAWWWSENDRQYAARCANQFNRIADEARAFLARHDGEQG